jgi:hypothetical protein
LSLKPLGGIPRPEINKRISPSAAKEEMSRAHEHSVYLSSFSVSHSSPIVWGTTGSSGSNNLVGEKDWKNWLKELRKLEVLTHHSFQRQLKHLEQKRRRSNTGKVDIAIKKASSMSNLG